MAEITFKGKHYELKPKGLKVVRAEDALYRVVGLEDAYRKQYEYIKACLGEESTAEALGGADKFEHIEDFDEVTMLCNKISAAYTDPIIKEQKDYIKKTLDKGLRDAVKTAKDAKSLKR